MKSLVETQVDNKSNSCVVVSPLSGYLLSGVREGVRDIESNIDSSHGCYSVLRMLTKTNWYKY